MAKSAESKVSTDHEEIRRWAEERGAKPSCVRGTGGEGDIGMIRLDFLLAISRGRLRWHRYRRCLGFFAT